MGLGAECDEAYIIDADNFNYLHCLEGHKNFVSSIVFEEFLNQNDKDLIEEDDDNSIDNLNMSVMETLNNEYGSNNINQKVKKFLLIFFFFIF